MHNILVSKNKVDKNKRKRQYVLILILIIAGLYFAGGIAWKNKTAKEDIASCIYKKGSQEIIRRLGFHLSHHHLHTMRSISAGI